MEQFTAFLFGLAAGMYLRDWIREGDEKAARGAAKKKAVSK